MAPVGRSLRSSCYVSDAPRQQRIGALSTTRHPVFASPVLPRRKMARRSLPAARRKAFETLRDFGAGDGIRTHDPNLGKVVDNSLLVLAQACSCLLYITFPLICQSIFVCARVTVIAAAYPSLPCFASPMLPRWTGETGEADQSESQRHAEDHEKPR